MIVRTPWMVLAIVLSRWTPVGVQSQPDPFVLSCQAYGADMSAASLSARFGAANVEDAEVYLGEGFYEAGTIVFPDDPIRRAEFTWRDTAAKRSPKMIRIQIEKDAKSRWRTPQGLTAGLALAAVERFNRRPFRLSGFGWDYGGTTISWSGGVLAEAEVSTCRVWARFGTTGRLVSDEQRRLDAQVMGGREFSSGHPAMQAAGAWVWQLGLSWRE